MVRTGWRCTACNRFYQGEDPPDPCEWCGERGALERIDHTVDPPAVAPGDVVRVERRGESFVGRVEGYDGGRVLVRDSETGLHRVRPADVAAVRERGTD